MSGYGDTGINIICVKWGDKYGPEYVNRLYRMVKKNLNHVFDFYCYTDDPTGLIPEVQVIPIPDDNDLEVWWNKLALFQAGMFSGLCLYFDVDVVICAMCAPSCNWSKRKTRRSSSSKTPVPASKSGVGVA